MYDFALAQPPSPRRSSANDALLSGTGGNLQFKLRDGSVCRIRPIEKRDRQRLQAAFQRLSPNSRRLRFFGVKKALTEAELDFLASPDGQDHIAYGAVRLDEHGNELEALGAARCIRLAPDSDTAELGIAVVDELQGAGIGGRLLRRLVDAARRQGIRRLRCEVLAENDAMRALAISMGGDTRRLDDGVLEYDCPLPEPKLNHDPLGLWVLLSAIEANLAMGFDFVGQTTESAVEGYAWCGRVFAGSLSSAFFEEIDESLPTTFPVLDRAAD